MQKSTQPSHKGSDSHTKNSGDIQIKAEEELSLPGEDAPDADDSRSVRTEEEVEKMRLNKELPDEPFRSDSEADDQANSEKNIFLGNGYGEENSSKVNSVAAANWNGSKSADTLSLQARVQAARERRKTQDIDETESRDYICGCGKEYLSYAALFTHSKIKHDSRFYKGTIFYRKNRYFLAHEGASTSMPSKGDFSEVTEEALMEIEYVKPSTKERILQVNRNPSNYRPPRVNNLPKVLKLNPEQLLQRIQAPKEKPEFISNESFKVSLANFEIFLSSLNCRAVDDKYRSKKDMEVSTAETEIIREEAHMFVVTQSDLQKLSFLPKYANGIGDPQELLDLFPMHWFSDTRIAQPVYQAIILMKRNLEEDFREVFDLDIDLINTEYDLNCTKAMALFLIFMFRQVSTQFYQELCVMMCFLRYSLNLIGAKIIGLENPSSPDHDSVCELREPNLIPEILSDFLTKHYYSAMVSNKQMLKSAAMMQILKPVHINRNIKVCKLFADWLYHFNFSGWHLMLSPVEYPTVAMHYNMQMIANHHQSMQPQSSSSSARAAIPIPHGAQRAVVPPATKVHSAVGQQSGVQMVSRTSGVQSGVRPQHGGTGRLQPPAANVVNLI